MKKIIQRPSPNFDDRGSKPIDILLLHYTGMPTAEEALDRLCSETAGVSAHYFVDLDGTITQMVDEEKRGWHAGVSYWAGETNINARSIGIEIVNPGHEFGYTDFPEQQIEAVTELSEAILNRHNIPAVRVLAHSDVAPLRKEDPGERFPWAQLSESGVGSWVSVPPEDAFQNISEQEFTQKLAAYGYGFLDETRGGNIEKTITAFQRHFDPTAIGTPREGKFNQHTSRILIALLATQF